MRKVMILFILTVVVTVTGIEAQKPTAIFPNLVLRDSTDEVVGPIVQITDNQLFLVLFHDSTDSYAPFLVLFGKDWFSTQDRSELYFSGQDCTGIAYLVTPTGIAGLPGMRGTVFARGPEKTIYRTIIGGTSANISYQSIYISFNFVAPYGQCINIPNNIYNLVEAVPVMDLSYLIAPFTIE